MDNQSKMKVIMYPAVTLDGFIADLEGECYSWISDEDETVYMDLMRKSGCSLVGRKTFDQYREDFPHDNGAMTYVYTKDTSYQNEEGITYVSGNPKEVLRRIEDDGFSQLVISGGGEINGLLASEGCVDEIIVSMYPITLGNGIPLFGLHKPQLKLELLSSTNEIKGIVKNHYKVLD